MIRVRALIIVVLCSILLFSCNKTSSFRDDVKFRLYYAQGEIIYKTRCSNCHQKSGKGLGLVYPPLDQSDYLDKKFPEVVCLIKHGINGELVVNQKGYNQPMPGVPTLTGLEIAELTTYIYNTWGREKGIVEFDKVNSILEKCEE